MRLVISAACAKKSHTPFHIYCCLATTGANLILYFQYPVDDGDDNDDDDDDWQ